MLRKIKAFLLQNRGTRQTVAKNIFWLSASQLGSRLIRGLIIIYAARILGAAEYGIFSYALGLAGFFTVFSDIGVGQIMTREAAKNPVARSYYFATAFWIKSGLLIFAALLIIFVAPYFSKIKGVEIIIPFVALLVTFDGLREFALSFFRALEKMEWEAFITIITNLIITASGFLVLYFSSTSRILIMTYTASVGLGAILAIIIIRQEFSRVLSHLKPELIKPLIKSSVPIAFSSALGAFMLNTDFVMLGWWQNAQAIGYYSAGQKIVQLLYTLPAIIASAIFPTLARLIGAKDNEKIRALMEKSLSLAFLISIPMFIGGVILATPIIKLIYGQAYIPAIGAFQALLVTVLIVFPGVLMGNAAIAYDKQKQITKYLFLAVISNIVFNAILIPVYGIVGSAYSTIIALTLDVGLVWLLLKKINNFYIFYHLKKIVTAAVIMGILSFFLDKIGVNVIFNIIISAVIYFGILYLIKEKILEEIKSIFGLVKISN